MRTDENMGIDIKVKMIDIEVKRMDIEDMRISIENMRIYRGCRYRV